MWAVCISLGKSCICNLRSHVYLCLSQVGEEIWRGKKGVVAVVSQAASPVEARRGCPQDMGPQYLGSYINNAKPQDPLEKGDEGTALLTDIAQPRHISPTEMKMLFTGILFHSSPPSSPPPSVSAKVPVIPSSSSSKVCRGTS